MKLFFIIFVLAFIGKCSSQSIEEISLDFLLSNFDKKVESLVDPSVEPTAEPTATPTSAPSFVPTTAPSFMPTTAPSFVPTTAPSSVPTTAPSFVPTTAPSNVPTIAPTRQPTAPSAAPTFVPTRVPTKNNLVAFTSQTTLDNVSPQQYEQNRKACNITIQSAVSSVMTGVSKDDIQDIIVSALSSRTNRRMQSGSSSKVKFTVRTFLDGATYESLSTQLEEAAVSGVLTSQVQTFAVQQNVPVLQNVTVLAVTTENELVGRDGSDKLTGTMVAGVVIGIFMCLGLLAVMGYFLFLYCVTPATNDEAVQVPNETSGSPVGESDENNNIVSDVESPREAANQI